MNEKNPAAVALGSLGGLARKKALTKEERVEIARKAGSAPKKPREARSVSRRTDKQSKAPVKLKKG